MLSCISLALRHGAVMHHLQHHQLQREVRRSLVHRAALRATQFDADYRVLHTTLSVVMPSNICRADSMSPK